MAVAGMWGDVDLGAEVRSAGSAELFVERTVAIRDVSALAAACDAQREALRSSQSAATVEASEVRSAAADKLASARKGLDAATSRAAEAVSEYEVRRTALQAIADAFAERRAAVAEEEAVKKCRIIADAYVNVLQTLQDHRKKDGKADMDTVAANIETLIREVELVRRAGPKSLFGESLAVNKRILNSIETRCIDAVIKARAAFVNVMDNEFRAFGWPMKVPHVVENGDMIAHVNFYVKQLHKLQRVAEQTPFVAQRTRWHSNLSDSWSMASILRAPLARFKYHFLENYHASAAGDTNSDDNTSTASSVVVDAEKAAAADSAARSATTRFDRPEWAADFALGRISEAAPFLREIVIENSVTADLKFAEGFCKVFANKIAYDSDIAIRGKVHDEGADSLISHAADIAAQFDAKIRAGIITRTPDWDGSSPLPSSLDILSANDDFFANWAVAELRLAQTNVLDAVNSLLSNGTHPVGGEAEGPGSALDVDVEGECAEIVERISQSSRGCRALDSKSRIFTFVKWTELHLLGAVIGALRSELKECDWKPKTKDSVFRAARAAWIAHAMAAALENKACDPFYVSLEKAEPDTHSSQAGRALFEERAKGANLGAKISRKGMNGARSSLEDDVNETNVSVYGQDIVRLRGFCEKACAAVADTMCDEFVECATAEYQNLVRFGEIVAPDAAIVLAHDLSEELISGMGVVETCLEGVATAVPNRKVAAQIWRPAAEALDSFFFGDIILQSWTGGLKNGVSAASPANKYMIPVSAAKMARQIAHDASVLVEIFRKVTPVPARWLGQCSEAARVIQVGAARVVRPKAAPRQEDEELLSAILSGADDDETSGDVTKVRESVGLVTLTPRECRECLVIAGMYDKLPME